MLNVRGVVLVFYILLFSVLFASSDFILDDISSNGYKVNFLLNDDLEFNKKDSFTSIKSSKGYTDILGMPKLPLYSTMIMIDPSKEYEVDFVVEKSKVIKNIKVTPTQNIQKGLEKTTVEIINNDFYNSFNSYPYVNVSISEPMVMRNIVVCNINVVPFNYLPKEIQILNYLYIWQWKNNLTSIIQIFFFFLNNKIFKMPR